MSSTGTVSEWAVGIEAQVRKTLKFIVSTFYPLFSKFLVESVSYLPLEKVKYAQGYMIKLSMYKVVCEEIVSSIPDPGPQRHAP